MERGTYSVNLAALRGKIVEKYSTLQKFAEVMGCSYTHILDLLNGKNRITLTTAQKMAKLLDLEQGEIFRIFFSTSN